MSHLDPDDLALLALGEKAGTRHDKEHLASCDQCRDDLGMLARTAAVGRSTFAAGELLEPPVRVWSRIRDELKLDHAEQPLLGADALLAEVITLVPRRRSRWLPGIAAAAATVLVVAGVGVASRILTPVPDTVVASATLGAFPGWVGSTGEAVVEQQADGARVITVLLDTPGDNDGYREVWLITSDATELVSLGVVRGAVGSFTVPDGLDLSLYDVVDVSAEPFDGNPAHSGDSILRGTLS